jgi:hypothetical protein
MHIAIFVTAFVIGFFATIRYVAFRRKNAVARFLRELVWNERDRLSEGVRKIPFLVIVEAKCWGQPLSSFYEEGTRHCYLRAQIRSGEINVHAYYRPDERERPYCLAVHFFEGEFEVRHLSWVARRGQVLRGDMRPFFFREECLALNTLDEFAREQGFPGLKPLPPSA